MHISKWRCVGGDMVLYSKDKVDRKVQEVLNQYFQMRFKKDCFLIGDPPKNYFYDMVSENRQIVVCIVGFSWLSDFTRYKSIIAGITEALFHLSYLPEEIKKILILKKRRYGKGTETLGKHFYGTNGCFLNDVELWEVDEKFSIKVYKKIENTLDKEPWNYIESTSKNDANIDDVKYSDKAVYMGNEHSCGINYLWKFGDEDVWNSALEKYWSFLRKENIPLEREFECLDSTTIEEMSVEEFYEFLYNKYFVWKFTAKNRLATTRMNLEKYKNDNLMDELKQIKSELFYFDKLDARKGLYIASKIKGLGIAGASGLLAILFPKYFGTVDQFVVKSLCKIEGLSEYELLTQMKPDDLKNQDGVILEKILRNKATELNKRFSTEKWTPRMIDKVLWSFER